MTDYQQRGETFSVLGSKYDLFEGIYGPADWKSFVSFLNLTGHQFVVPFLRTTLFVITNKFLCMILIINILLRFLWIQI